MSFRNITAVLLSSSLFFLMPRLSLAFQVESSALSTSQSFAEQLLAAEGGDWARSQAGIVHLFEGSYPSAVQETKKNPSDYPDWFAPYLDGLVQVSSGMVVQSSRHFELWTPPDQAFLGTYALPALEQASDFFSKNFDHRPRRKIRVEIYPTKEAFSSASTLSVATLESSGAIGICKFHRLMIVSPQALPIGYRWLDALTHEYTHLMINELSASHAELWLHEGIARYFETAPRVQPPLFLTPQQKSDLKKAQMDEKLISFQRMSPSMVYLKDQTEVSLAFSQVAYAVSILIRQKGEAALAQFLRTLKEKSFVDAFQIAYGRSPQEFQMQYQDLLKNEQWDETKGAMSDEVRFTPVSEEESVGAEARMQMLFGDRMRQKGLYDSARLEYERALEQEPDNAILLLKAARACLALNQEKDAKEYLERAILKNPNYVTPYVELSKLVDKKRAEELLKVGLALNPFDPQIHEGLGTREERDIAAFLRSQKR